jgi:predicted  nucleic acid-binding Zn-ribbon protein
LTGKLKLFLLGAFVSGWLFLIPSTYSHATENLDPEQVIVSPDQTILSAESAISSAENTASVLVEQVQDITSPSEAISGNIVQAQEAIQDAQEALASAESAASAVESATTAVSTAQEQVSTAESSVSTAQTSVQNIESQITTQTATVATNQTAVNAAQAVVDAATTPGLTMTVYSNPGTNASPNLGGNNVGTTTDINGINENWGLGGPTVNGGTTTSTETFAGNRLNTDINITVNGTQVSTTNNSGVYIGSIGWPGGSDPSLSLYSPSATTTIIMPANTISAGFSVFAKNGNTTGTITYTDGTSETYTLQHNVSSEYPNYVHQETFTAPSGKTIANVTIPIDWDYFAIDNVSATKQSTTTVSEDFQVKWSGYWTPQYTGTQYVYAPADDGVKLYLDGELVIDDWIDKGGGGSTADIPTIAGTPKTFEMWYYENGGGANVSLQRYTGSGWEVIPASEFSKTIATTEQRQALATANNNLQSSQTTLTSLQQQLASNQQSLTIAQGDLESAQINLTTAQENLTIAQTNLESSVIVVQAAVEIMNNKISYVQNLVSAALVAQQSANLSSGPVQNQPSDPTPVEPEPVEPVEPEPSDPVDPTDEIPSEDDGSQDTDTPGSDEPSSNDGQDNTPEENQGTDNNSQDNNTLSVEEIQEAVGELIEDGTITASDVEAVLEALSSDGEITTEEVVNLSEALSEDGVLTLAEKDLISEALVVSADGAPIQASAIAEAGLEYRDLPPQIPVEVREDANGNPVVITAEVASALLTLESPAAFIGAIAGCFNPEEAVEGLTEEQKCELGKALANIGADMSPQERQDAKEVLVAAILVGQVIIGSSILRIRG